MIEINHLSDLIQRRSHCGLGHTATHHILDSLQNFPKEIQKNLVQQTFTPPFNLDEALDDARKITQRDDAAAHLK